MRFFSTAWRACIGAVAACSVLLALSGCGAGVVGTGSGTGDDGGEDIRYTPLPLCKAPFSEGSLDCPTGGREPPPGTAAVTWADADKANQNATVIARLEANTMSLQLPCSGVSFLGNWGAMEDGTRGFVGRYTGPAATEGRPSIVLVLPAPNEPGAVGWLQVMDGSGSQLFGPWLVTRVEGGVGFAACRP